MITGLTKSYSTCLEDTMKVIDPMKNHIVFSYSIFIARDHNIIIADSSINQNPTSDELADIAIQAASVVEFMGDKPRVAFLASSNFGSRVSDEVSKVQKAVKILENQKVNFEFDGEMTAEVALNPKLRELYPFMRLSSTANILIMPNLNTALLATQLLEELAGGVFIGPIMTGLEHQVQIVQVGSSATEIYNFAAMASVGAK
jgi:malate dehydrogenase (oxaloacetate-decarboxylating)(NADP+)